MARDLTEIKAKDEAEDWQRRVEKRQEQGGEKLTEFEKKWGRIDLNAALDGFLAELDLTIPENFEEVLVWAVIQYQGKYDLYDLMGNIKLKVDDFLIYHKTWEEFIERYEKGEPINFMVKFKTLSRSKLADLAKLYFGIGITPGQVPYYCKMIRHDWINRQVKSFTDQTLVDEFYEKHKYEDYMPPDPYEEIANYHDAKMRKLDQVERGYYGIKTGYSWFDLDIGLNKGQLITIAGRPGLGKSSLALNLATGAARNGHSVGFLSLEMAREEVYNRAIASTSKEYVNLTDLANPKMRKKIGELEHEFIERHERLTIMTPNKSTTRAIADIAFNYDVLVIDQLS